MALEAAGLTWYNENLNTFIKDVGKANRAMASTGEAAGKASGGFDLLGSVVTGVAIGFTTFALDAVAKLGSALVDLGASSIGVAADFQGMSVALDFAGAQYKDAADAVGGFDEIALKVGGDTRLMGVSATGAADAMTGLLKSGLSLQDVMGETNAYMKEGAELGGALRASIDLAAATELDMVQASDLAVIVMSTFGKTAEDVTGAMDFLVKTADASVAEVSDLSAAMINVGPTAAAAGIEFEDVNTALALLSTRGIRGAEAGTALKSMLANIRRPTKKVREELDKWGISLYDSEGQMYDMVNIIGQFEIALEDATEEERALAIQTVAGTYGMNAMNALLGEGVQGWQDMTVAIGGATDMSAKAAAQSQTYAGQMEALEGVIETLRIRIGTALLPALTDILKIFSGLIEEYGPQLSAMFERVGAWLGTVTEEAARLIGIFMDAGWAEFFVVFEDGSSYIGSFLETLGLGEGVANAVGNAISRVAQFVGELVTAFEGGWPEIQAVLMEWAGKFWDWLTGPGGAVEAGTGVVAEMTAKIGEWLANNWPTISAKLLEWAGMFWDWVKEEVIPAAKEKLAVVAQAIEDWAKSPETQASLEVIGEEVGRGLVEGVRLLIGAVATWTPIIIDLAGAFAEAAVKSLFPAMREVGKGITGGIVEGIAESLGIEVPEAVKEALSEVGLLAGGPVGGLLYFQEKVEDVGEAWGDLRKIFSKEGKKIEKEVPQPFEKAADETRGIFEDLSDDLVGGSIVPDMMKKMDDEVESGLKAVLRTMINAMKALVRAVSEGWDEIVSAVRSGISEILGVIGGALKDFAKKGQEIAENIASGISGAWSTVSSAISSGLDELTKKIAASLSSFLQKGRDIASNIADGISKAWGTVSSAISSGLNALGQNIASSLGSFMQKGRDIASNIASGVSAAWNTVVSAISSGMGQLGTAITSALGSIVQAGRNIASSIASGISAGWETVSSTLSNLASGLVDAVFGVGSTIAANIVSGISSGLNLLWNIVTTVLSGLASGLSTAVDWISKVVSVGGKIVSGIIEGVAQNWQKFVSWLKDQITGIFGASEPTNPASPFRSEKLQRSGEWIGEVLAKGIQAGLAQGLTVPFGMPPVGVSRTISVPIGPVMIGNQMDAEVFAQRVKQVVIGAI